MKRRSQITAGWSLLTIALGYGLATSTPAADWPQYRGAQHNGTSPETIRKSWPVEGLKLVWKRPVTNGFSSFAIGQGQVFTLEQRELNGSPQEVCLALDAATGKELWATPLGLSKYQGGGDDGAKDNRGGDGPRSTPSLDGDRVYTLSALLVLSCLDRQTGKPVWQKDLCREYGGNVIGWQNAASPLIDGDLIFVNGTAPNQCFLALNKNDGQLAWKGQNDKMTHATPIAATILGARQIIFFTQSGLVAVKPANGEVLWRYAFPFRVSTAASPVVGGDIVYCSAGYGVGAGAAKITKNGDSFVATELWRLDDKGERDKPGRRYANHWSTPISFEGHLYGLFSFKEYGTGPLKCIELATGKELWAKEGFGAGGVLLANGQLVVLSDAGEVALVEATPKAFTEKARFKAIAGKCWNAPALSGGRLYVRSTKEAACFEVVGE